jgi:ABC-2 type transport system permease protein
MTKVLAIIKRETIAYFSSPLAYIVLTAFLFMQGYVFYIIISYLNDPRARVMEPLRLVFGGTIFFWLFLLFIASIITMRLVAEELRSGTVETLLTSPVTELQVVVGKFLAAVFFYTVLWLPLLIYVLLLSRYAAVDLRVVAAFYVGVILLGGMLISVGLFASTLSRNQIIAAVIAFALFFVFFSAGLAEQLLVSSSWGKSVLAHMNLWTQMDDYARGIVDTRHVVFTISVALLFLFLAGKSLEARKWR